MKVSSLSLSVFSHLTSMFFHSTLREIRKKRPFVISRSTFSGQGQFGGHWTGDNKASYYDMYKSISGSCLITLPYS